MLIGKKLISFLDNDLIFLQMHQKSNKEKVVFQLPVNFIKCPLENKAKSNYFYTELCHETVLAVTVSNRPHFLMMNRGKSLLWLSAIGSNAGGISYGISLAFTSPVLPDLISQGLLTPQGELFSFSNRVCKKSRTSHHICSKDS